MSTTQDEEGSPSVSPSEPATAEEGARRGYHHGSLRAALIEAALGLIGERGPDGFTLREAARRAGVSPAAPYRHFPDKTALLAAVATEAIQQVDRVLTDAVEEAGDDPLEQLRAQGVAFVRFAVEHPAHFRAMYAPDVLDPDRFPELSELSQRTNSIAWRIVRKGQRAGVIRADDPAATALASVAMVYGLARLFVDGMLPEAGGNADVAEHLTHAVHDVLAEGLAVHSPG